MSETLPAIFFGHGNPMNAVLTNSYTAGWRRIGADIPRPEAILAISAHWFVPETAVTINAAPRTIHDSIRTSMATRPIRLTLFGSRSGVTPSPSRKQTKRTQQ